MAQLDLAAVSPARSFASERSPLRHIDVPLLLGALALAVYGLFMVYSSTQQTLRDFGNDPQYYLKRQGAFLVAAVAAMVVASVIDYRVGKVYAWFIYAGTLLLLLLVQTPLGSSALGAQRWFQFGTFQFSPSLFGRVALVVVLAAFLSEIRGELRLGDVFRTTALAALPMALVFIQPDIGTTLILAAIVVALLVVAGTKARYLAVLALVAALGIGGVFRLGFVHAYQIERITGFLDSSSDLQRANYNKRQAEIAIGAGGFTGKGYLHGSQTNLDYVPEQHTDFIFTVVGEELGFVGAIFLLGLFALLLWRALRIATLARDRFGTFLAVGVGAMIAIQVFVNVGMTVGIMPITGIPLPFISYGGSALIADFIGVGLLMNVHARRFV